MRVQATKTMTNAINDYMRKEEKPISAHFVKMDAETYERFVDYDLFRHTDDYDYTKQLFSVIKIEYDPEFYAISKYLTTRDMHNIFIDTDDKTLPGFMSALYNYIEI